LIIALVLSVGCSAKKDEYKVSEQVPANYITPDRDEGDVVRYGESACRTPAPFTGTAYEYLETLVNTGGRRSGTQGYRCAAAFARDQLASFGYEVDELEFTYPYYDFIPCTTACQLTARAKERSAGPGRENLPAASSS
jgi:hypothetical protein